MKNIYTVLSLTLIALLIYSTSYGQRILLSQGFENGPYTVDSLPLKWAKVKVNGPGMCTDADWRARDSGFAFCGTSTNPSFTSKSFNSKRALNIPWTASTGTITDDWVFTDSLRIATGDSLIFWVQLGTYPSGGGTYYLDSLQIWVTSGQTPATQISKLATVTSLPATDNIYQQKKYNLSAYNGQRIYVAFRYYMNTTVDGIMANVDSVMVRNLSSGPPPACNYSFSAQTSGTANQLLTVSAVSDQVAWAGGVGPTVIRTTNGGTSWTSATGTGLTGGIYSISAVDANNAVCTSTPATTTFIYRTTNGGVLWTQVYSLASGFIDGLQMISATEGYGLGDPVGGKWTVVKTTDGGATWARMATEPTQIGTDAGWNNAFQISGTNMWFGTNGTKVYHSTDLGVTWTNGASTGTANTYALHFNNPSNGMACGTAVVKSIDGGTTYSAATSYGTSGNMNGMEGGTGSDFWAIRTDANIYRTTDQGTSWTTAYTQTGAVFEDMDFKVIAGCPQGWAVGDAGAVAKMQTVTGISNYNSEVPDSYLLKQNFPNPFNPTTNIDFSIPKSGLVTLKVYDVTGKEVSVLLNEVKSPGNYIVGFNASNLPSGAYFYRLETGSFVDTKKMILVK